MIPKPIRVAALYRFARFDDPQALRAPLLTVAERVGVRGTILLATEGLNGTIAGPEAGVEHVLDHIRALPGCAGLEVKNAQTDTIPFHRLKIRLKREIVTMGVPGLDPLREAGTYVAADDWNALIEAPDTIVIDTRNDYEVAVGTFAGAMNPNTHSFRDFPAWFAAHHDELDGKRIAMFCTGGIRCEKATAFVRAQGIADVHHLDGGILRYLETIPENESRWQGECFVFDERVAVGHALAPGTHASCRACRMPVGPADRKSPHYEEGVACPRCHDRLDDARRAGLAERHRQMALAAARGTTHLGTPAVNAPPVERTPRRRATECAR